MHWNYKRSPTRPRFFLVQKIKIMKIINHTSVDEIDSPIFSPDSGSAKTDSTDVSQEAAISPFVAKAMKLRGITFSEDGTIKEWPQNVDDAEFDAHSRITSDCHREIDMLVSYLRVLDFIRHGHEDYVTEEHLKDLPWDPHSEEDLIFERLARVALRVLELENYYRFGCKLDEYHKAVRGPKDSLLTYTLFVCRALDIRIHWVFYELIPEATAKQFPDDDLIPNYPHVAGPLRNPRKNSRKFE